MGKKTVKGKAERVTLPDKYTRKILEEELKKISPDIVEVMLHNGSFIPDQAYELVKDSDTGRYSADFSKEYLDKLHEILPVKGAEDRADELLYEGFTRIPENDTSKSLYLYNRQMEVDFYSFENQEGEIQTVLSVNGTMIDLTEEQALELDQKYIKKNQDRMFFAHELEKLTGYGSEFTMRLALQLEDPGNIDCQEYATTLREKASAYLENVASSPLWDKMREPGVGEKSMNPVEIVRFGSMAEKSEMLEEMTGTGKDLSQQFNQPFIMEAARIEVKNHLVDLDEYHTFVDSLKGNIELVAQMTGTQDEIIQFIAGNGTEEDMKKYLSVNIPTDRVMTEEKYRNDPYLNRECSDKIAHIVFEEAKATVEAGNADFTGCSRKTFMSTLGSIESSEGLTEEQKETLMHSFCKSLSNGQRDFDIVNDLLHCTGEKKFEHSEKMMGAGKSEQAASFKEFLESSVNTIVNEALDHAGKLWDAMKEIRDRFMEESIGTSIHYILTGKDTGGVSFEHKNLGTFFVELTESNFRRLREMEEKVRETAKEFLHKISGDPKTALDPENVNAESPDGEASAKAHERTSDKNAHNIEVEYIKAFENDPDNPGVVTLKNEELIAYNVSIKAKEMALDSDLNLNDMIKSKLSTEFVDQNRSYFVRPVIFDTPENTGFNYNAAATGVDGKGYLITIEPELTDKSFHDHIRTADRMIPDSYLIASMTGHYETEVKVPVMTETENGYDFKPESVSFSIDNGMVAITRASGERYEIGSSEKLEAFRAIENRSLEEIREKGLNADNLYEQLEAGGFESFSLGSLYAAIDQVKVETPDGKESVTKVIEHYDRYLSEHGLGENVFSRGFEEYQNKSIEHGEDYGHRNYDNQDVTDRDDVDHTQEIDDSTDLSDF